MLTGGWRPRKRVDFCPAITQGAWVAVCEEGVVALPRPLALGRRAALALALGAGAALAVRVAGPTEWARLVSVGAAVVALLATCRLGALLYGGPAGLVAGLALATSLGFVLEARTLRPDMILTATVVVALLCWQTAERCGARRARWLTGLYAALGVGVLAKGLVPLVLAGLPIAAVTLRDHGWP